MILLGEIKDIVLEGLGLLGSQNLGIHRPSWVSGILNGLVEVLRGKIRVGTWFTTSGLAMQVWLWRTHRKSLSRRRS